MWYQVFIFFSSSIYTSSRPVIVGRTPTAINIFFNLYNFFFFFLYSSRDLSQVFFGHLVGDPRVFVPPEWPSTIVRCWRSPQAFHRILEVRLKPPLLEEDDGDAARSASRASAFTVVQRNVHCRACRRLGRNGNAGKRDGYAAGGIYPI